MNGLEHIFNHALEKLKKGSPVEETVSTWPEHKEELSSLLQMAQNLSLLPKNQAPQPAMRRKFMLSPAKRLWLFWLPFSKMATVSLSLVLVLSAVAGTGYAALKSMPGEALFSLKKSAEHLQMQLAFSPQAKVNLQVEIAKKRLDDAQQVFSNPQSQPQQEQAALNELLAETKNSIDVVNTQAHNNPQAGQGHPLVASLENITNQQQALIKQIKPKSQVSQLTKNALTASRENADKVTEIKKYLLAASNEQALTRLQNNPNVVTISGNVTQNSKDKITVEKTAFVINKDTVIKDDQGNFIKTGSLSAQMKVSVIANKQNDNLLAVQIVVLETAASSTPNSMPENVRSASSTASSGTTSAASLIKKTEKPESADNTTPPTPDPNAASGSFIIEDPAPQSAF